MADKKESSQKGGVKEYDKKLSIEGTLDDVLKVSLPKKPKKKKAKNIT